MWLQNSANDLQSSLAVPFFSIFYLYILFDFNYLCTFTIYLHMFADVWHVMASEEREFYARSLLRAKPVLHEHLARRCSQNRWRQDVAVTKGLTDGLTLSFLSHSYDNLWQAMTTYDNLWQPMTHGGCDTLFPAWGVCFCCARIFAAGAFAAPSDEFTDARRSLFEAQIWANLRCMYLYRKL